MFDYDVGPGLRKEDGGPPFGPQTLSDGPHATGIVDRISDWPVPLPAVDGGRVAWSMHYNGISALELGL